ncbi:MAG: flagellar hook-associated protein FlgK, partial [Planctomycetota bacterium]|nr:flagellar hook-associated protein FlgK [Planctomycetota bacterium]
MGLYAALHMSGRSLQAFTTGISVAGQNVANANTPGYIREELNLDPSSSYRSGSLVFGTGVQVSGIRQQINTFLETRVHAAKGDLAASSAKSGIYSQLETVLNELGDDDLSTALSDFFSAIQNLANEPDQATLRQALIGQGTDLARDITDLRTRVDEIRSSQNLQLQDLVKEANALIDEIDRLNPQITQVEAGGLLQSDAGALRTQRYNALQRLSEIVPVQYRDRGDGGIDVFMGGDWLILDGAKQNLEIFSQPDRGLSLSYVRTTSTRSLLPDGAGQLRGIIDGRDEIAGGFIDDLDRLTANLVGEFNRIYSSGDGAVGYTALLSERGISDTAAALNAAGLPFNVKHGGFDLKVVNQATGEVTTTRITIDLDGLNANDTTLASLTAVVGAVTNVTASIDTSGRLSLAAANGYELKFGDDTSGALAALGINTFFSGKDSGSIAVQQSLRADPRLLATGRGGGPGDNRNVAALARVLDTPIPGLQGQSLTGFYESVVSKIGQSAAAESGLAQGSNAYLQSLLSQREQYSGVSLDEETIKIMEFQRSFQSAARLISTIDELLG